MMYQWRPADSDIVHASIFPLLLFDIAALRRRTRLHLTQASIEKRNQLRPVASAGCEDVGGWRGQSKKASVAEGVW